MLYLSVWALGSQIVRHRRADGILKNSLTTDLPISSICAMPIIKSAIKRARQNEIRRKRRLPVKSYMKTMMRKMSDLAKDKKKDEAEKVLPLAYKAIDMAAKKHIIHPRNAARKKSAMSKLLASI